MPRKLPAKTRRVVKQSPTAAPPGGAEFPDRGKTLAELAAESDRQLEELIARRLALPLDQRLNFLRRRLPGGGSCL